MYGQSYGQSHWENVSGWSFASVMALFSEDMVVITAGKILQSWASSNNQQ